MLLGFESIWPCGGGGWSSQKSTVGFDQPDESVRDGGDFFLLMRDPARPAAPREFRYTEIDREVMASTRRQPLVYLLYPVAIVWDVLAYPLQRPPEKASPVGRRALGRPTVKNAED